MKLLTKLKKVLLFIIKQCKKILRTVFQSHFYNDKKSYNNGNFGFIFNISTITQKLLFLLNSFSRLNLLIFFRFIHKEYRFYSIYQTRETRHPNLSQLYLLYFSTIFLALAKFMCFSFLSSSTINSILSLVAPAKIAKDFACNFI